MGRVSFRIFSLPSAGDGSQWDKGAWLLIQARQERNRHRIGVPPSPRGESNAIAVAFEQVVGQQFVHFLRKFRE
jgi:hypothetical protein